MKQLLGSKTRMRFLVELDPAVPPEVREHGDELASFVPMDAVGEDGSLDASCAKPISSLLGSYTYFADGDVLLAKVTPCFENGKGAIAKDLIGENGFATTEVYALRPSPLIGARFLDYVLRSSSFRQYGAARLKGAGGLRRVSADDVLNFTIVLPDVDEQRAIADYLDRETARIDTLIEEQQRLIEMLRERRQAVIDVEISERAGVPVVQLRAIVRRPIDAGVDEAGDSSNPAEWPRFVRTTDISSLTTLDPDKRVTINPAVAAQATLTRNDLVATRAGATIGKTYIHLSDEEACYAGYLVRISPDTERVEPIYLAFWSQSRHYLDQVAVGAVKSTIENYSASKYRATRIPLPPLDEQRRIAAYLDEQTAKIDTLIAETETFIELARERRSALITAAVTGQIDVRGAA